MELMPVVSSNITDIGYDEELRVLYIRFKTGDLWQYHDFDLGRWNAFRLDKSKGKYFTKFIRPHFKGEKCAEQEGEEQYDEHGVLIKKDSVQFKKPPKKKEIIKVTYDMASGKDRTNIRVIRTGSIEL